MSCLFESLEPCDSLDLDLSVKVARGDGLGDNTKVHDLDEKIHNNQSERSIQKLIAVEHTLMAWRLDTTVNGICATEAASLLRPGGKILILRQQ